MGLIIKNLDMPDENTTIIFTVKKNKAKLQVFKKVEDNTVIHKIVSDVVELEKPHGRIIDAGKVFCYNNWDEQNIKSVPTIVEAEE